MYPYDPEYLTAHKASNIKVGDKVTIYRLPTQIENEWGSKNYRWIKTKNAFLGQILTVIKDDLSHGFILDTSKEWHFPYYVLRKIEDNIKPVEKFPINIQGQIFNLPKCIIKELQ